MHSTSKFNKLSFESKYIKTDHIYPSNLKLIIVCTFYVEAVNSEPVGRIGTIISFALSNTFYKYIITQYIYHQLEFTR